MACIPLISDDFVFPRPIENRAGLPRIGYRIGRYADFAEFMRRGIDAAPELAAWTHRESDDPAIALLEGAAILGDILGFYQEHYANEAYLRTARWRESVAELVRLTGYRLAPGIGGRATLAFEARKPLTLPAGFAVKADLQDVPQPADLRTDAELRVWPHLGRLALYRQRHYAPFIAGAQNRLEVAAVGGAADSLALDALDLKKGDRLLLLPEENVFALLIQLFLLGWTLDQPAEEIVIVDKVERVNGRVLLTLAGTLTHGWLAGCRAFKLGRSFRHFGAGAPPQYVSTDTSTTPPTTSSVATHYTRELFIDTNYGAPYAFIAAQAFALDQEVQNLAAGQAMVVTGSLPYGGGSVPFAVSRRITAVGQGAATWGNLAMPASFVRLDDKIAPAWSRSFAAQGDVRTLRAHETVGAVLNLLPLATGAANAFGNGTNALRLYATAAQARAIAGRRLHLSHRDGRSAELVCTNVAGDFPLPAGADAPKMWPLSFDRAPAPFTRADFDEADPAVTVFGNLVDASQGKLEKEAVLGNGDARQAFQTFALPKSPLTYFLASGSTPPQAPELEVRVAGRLWTRVDSFFGRGPAEALYIVREDADGRSFVQFGDGITGARLPSGLKNVVAVYRTGVGARGPVKHGTTPIAAARPDGFDKLTLAGIVAGGADPEDLDKAREAAPARVQSLGRLVGIRDYESETLALPGVVAVSAAWEPVAGVPAVLLRVLLEAGREAEFSTVRALVNHAQRCRGPDRHPLVVQQALLRYAFADIAYAYDPALRREDVEAAMRSALGVVGDAAGERSGLFGLRARRIGAVEYASRVEGRLQQVAGVRWCRVDALGLFAAGATDPAALALPAPPRALSTTLPCAALELLQLAPQHLSLTATADVAAGECA